MTQTYCRYKICIISKTGGFHSLSLSLLNSAQSRNKENLITFHILLSATQGHATQSQLWGAMEMCIKVEALNTFLTYLQNQPFMIIRLKNETNWDTSIYSFEVYS